MGRDKFIDKVWEWKDESGGIIFNQLKRLGASCDWSRERFTMDEGLSKAVLEVFVTLHKQGLVYKDKRLVNWDPKLLTAISDIEVEQIEVDGNLWHFRYPLSRARPFDPEDRRAPSLPSPRRGRKPCWATPASPSIRMTSATRPGRQARRAADRWPADSGCRRHLFRSRKRAPVP